MQLVEFIILFITAFLPPIIFAIWIRNTEKYNRERWKSIILCFIWGATIAVIAAIILEYILHYSIIPSIKNQQILPLISVLAIAPFAEELTKPLALSLKTVKKELDEIEEDVGGKWSIYEHGKCDEKQCNFKKSIDFYCNLINYKCTVAASTYLTLKYLYPSLFSKFHFVLQKEKKKNKKKIVF